MGRSELGTVRGGPYVETCFSMLQQEVWEDKTLVCLVFGNKDHHFCSVLAAESEREGGKKKGKNVVEQGLHFEERLPCVLYDVLI